MIWWVVSQPLSNIFYSQLGWPFPIHGKIKNVPKHQPVIVSAIVSMLVFSLSLSLSLSASLVLAKEILKVLNARPSFNKFQDSNMHESIRIYLNQSASIWIHSGPIENQSSSIWIHSGSIENQSESIWIHSDIVDH